MGITVIFVAAISAWLVVVESIAPLEALRHAAFNVVSLISTTGFASSDYALWGTFPVTALFFLMCIGGCTGSTSGGIKIFRFTVLHAIAKNQIARLIRPHGVFVLTFNGRPVSEAAAIAVMAFVFMFGLSFSVFALLLSMLGLDHLTAMSAAVTALANVGPGLGEIIGPAGNFSTLPEGAKWLLSAAMLLGRLELFTVLVLLTPAFWRHLSRTIGQARVRLTLGGAVIDRAPAPTCPGCAGLADRLRSCAAGRGRGFAGWARAPTTLAS